jgi:signal transduction histidine kinase
MLRGLRETPDGGFGRAHELKGWCFLTLDTEYLHGEFLHELTERHFGRGEQSDYRVEVTAGPRVVYRSDTSATHDERTAEDSAVVLFVPHVQPGLPPPHPPHAAVGRTREPAPPFAHGPAGSPMRMSGPTQREGPGAWRLALSYKAGSLESLVARARRRNLALSFGVLLLLAASTVALGLAARRARRLARQQMEFVAGVSHELRTPLTVIQSTSYNLSKGTVQDPARVRRYGAVIQEEARKLIAEIERMLSFAGVQSGRAVYDFRPLDVCELVGRALAEFRPAFDEDGWTVEEDLAAGLPPVPADARAIESAVKNLLENGLKYGAEGKWLRVAVHAARNGKGAEVRVRVEDGGPGVAPADLPRIFEPFYRGRAAHDSAAGGAGLGLALVRRHAAAHGGRVTVSRSERGGASFTLHLPVKEGVGCQVSGAG